MIRVQEAILVEGRYDKNALKQVVDAPVFETSGFGVMKDKARLAFLKAVAEKRGLVILTDSDGAGFVIRNRLKGQLPADRLYHAYIPDVAGKEKRKQHGSKEGKLGVEGMPPEVLLDAIRRSGAHILGEDAPVPAAITRTDLYAAGLFGKADSRQRRRALQKELGLPEHLGTGAFLDALNLLWDRESFLAKITDI